MKRWIEAIRRLHADQQGETIIEWTLLLVAFGIPIIAVFAVLLAALVEHYRMVSFLVTLPFP
jgi:Flp pilus assembly pilin Flp